MSDPAGTCRAGRRQPVLAAVLLGLAALGGTQAAGAQPSPALAWPVKPLRLVIPFAPGGTTDNIGRLVAQRLADLTERERDVMQRVVTGRPNKLIADELNISVRTVEVHRARIFEKMGVKSAVELANGLRSAGQEPA